MTVDIPRLVIAGLSGDSGKTVVSMSLLAVLRRKAMSLSVFKKGPDYIDAAWLSRIAGADCYNLDTFMVPAERVRQSFLRYAQGSQLAVIEGNRGLYDGKDVMGTHSTAELAKLLEAPVLLVVDCTKSTRTVAALVKGCSDFDPQIRIAGVVLNRVAGMRHQQTIQQALEQYCDIPVIGVIPKLSDESGLVPGRHLGLIPPTEFQHDSGFVDRLVSIGAEHLDLDKIIAIAGSAPAVEEVSPPQAQMSSKRVKIGYFRDPVFTFYYPENLTALESAGAELVPISSLDDGKLPQVSGLYIGGGFPETFVKRLAENRSLLAAVKAAADHDLPIYAECGGLIYLCRSLTWKGDKYELAGVFPLDLEVTRRPQGHGYTELEVDHENPFLPVGQTIRGHEFHYSGPVSSGDPLPSNCLHMKSGVGLGSGRDGLLYRSTLACYTHIHADGVENWASGFVAAAVRFGGNQAGGTGLKPSTRPTVLSKSI